MPHNSRPLSYALMFGASALVWGALTAPAFAQSTAHPTAPDAPTQTGQSSELQGPATDQAGDTTPHPATSSKDARVGEVVVTAQRRSLQSAQAIKKNSEQIVDSITAVDIGALPDRSVTEALQRVSGVTITRTDSPGDADRISEEGTGVQIRGLSYVRGEINGRDAFSAKSGRQLSFDDIPSELLAGVDVYKNPSADLIEGGIGGTVNLRTRLPFDSKGFVGAFSADYSYADLRHEGSPAGSLLLSDRWDTKIGEFGVLVDLSESQFKSRTDTLSVDPYQARTDLVPGSTVYVPTGFGYRQLDFDRVRKGVDVAAQWRPMPNLLFTGQVIHSEDYQQEFEHAVGLDSGTTNGPAAGTNFTYDSQGRFLTGTIADTAGGTTNTVDVADARYNNRYTASTDYSLNMKYDVTSHLTVTADVQYIFSKTKALDFTLFENTTVPAATLDLTGQYPKATIPQTAALLDPSQYFYSAAMDYHQANKGDEYAERIDAEYTFGDDWLKSVRVGFRHTDRDATDRETNYNWGYVSQNWTGATDGNFLGGASGGPLALVSNAIPNGSSLVSYNNFFRGDVTLPGKFILPNFSIVQNYARAIEQILAAEKPPGGGWAPFSGDYTALGVTGGEVNYQTEETFSGYLLARFGHRFDLAGGERNLDGNVGGRVVATQTTAEGQVQFAEPSTNGDFDSAVTAFTNGARTSITDKNSYLNFLPSLNLRLQWTPQLQFRFAAAKAVVRPDFTQLQPVINIGATAGYTAAAGGACSTSIPTNSPANCIYQYTGYAGNPNLKPVRSSQYDFATEWYFAPTGSITATIFYKDLYNFITSGVNSVPYTNNGVTEDVLVTQPYNAGHGEVKGIEFDYQQYYDFLPGPLKGIGFQGNFTYVDSYGGRNAAADPYASTQVSAVAAGAPGPTLPLEGLSRYTYNVAGLYDRGPFSARIAYNWRSTYLLTTSAANINIPAYYDAYGQLDGSFFYTVNTHLKLGVEVANITDSRSTISVSYPSTPNPGKTAHNYVDADRRFTMSLRGTF